jgi:hypothetical protein
MLSSSPVSKVFFLCLLISFLALSPSIAAPDFDLTPISNLNPSPENANIVFSLRDSDIQSLDARGGSDPVVFGEVKNLNSFLDDTNNPYFSIAVFKHLSDGSDQWLSTTSHHYNTNKNRFRFRIGISGLENTQDPQVYRFYVLTSRGAEVAGPFEQAFHLSSNSNILDTGKPFPAGDIEGQTGLQEDQLNALLSFIAQRVIVKSQPRRSSVGGMTLNTESNTIELSLPTNKVKVEKNKQKGSIVQLITNGETSGEGNTGSSLNLQGNFNNTLTYKTGDIISNDSSSFVAKTTVPAGLSAPSRTNINSNPTNQYWMLLAAGGQNGASGGGATGPAGSSFSPKGAFSATSSYNALDLVSNDNASFVALTSVAAGLSAPTQTNINTAPTNSRWMLVAASSTTTVSAAVLPSVTNSENISLPSSSAEQTAAKDINSYDGLGSHAAGLVFTSSAISGNNYIIVRFHSVSRQPLSYQFSSSSTVTNFATVPVSPATAFTFSGFNFAFYLGGDNKIRLINKSVVPGDAPTVKTITVGYQNI